MQDDKIEVSAGSDNNENNQHLLPKTQEEPQKKEGSFFKGTIESFKALVTGKKKHVTFLDTVPKEEHKSFPDTVPIKNSNYRWAYFLLAVSLFILGLGALFLFAPLALIPVFFVASIAIKTAVAWLGVLLTEIGIGVFFRKMLEKSWLQTGAMMAFGLVANFFSFAVVLSVLAAVLGKFVLGYMIVAMISMGIYINVEVSDWRAKKAADESSDKEESQDTSKNKQAANDLSDDEASRETIIQQPENTLENEQAVAVKYSYYNGAWSFTRTKEVPPGVRVVERSPESDDFSEVQMLFSKKKTELDRGIKLENYKNNSELVLLKLEIGEDVLYYEVRRSHSTYISNASNASNASNESKVLVRASQFPRQLTPPPSATAGESSASAPTFNAPVVEVMSNTSKANPAQLSEEQKRTVEDEAAINNRQIVTEEPAVKETSVERSSNTVITQMLTGDNQNTTTPNEISSVYGNDDKEPQDTQQLVNGDSVNPGRSSWPLAGTEVSVESHETPALVSDVSFTPKRGNI